MLFEVVQYSVKVFINKEKYRGLITAIFFFFTDRWAYIYKREGGGGGGGGGGVTVILRYNSYYTALLISVIQHCGDLKTASNCPFIT